MYTFWLTSTFTLYLFGGSIIGAFWWKSSSHLPPKRPDTCFYWFPTADVYDLRTVYCMLLPRTSILKWIHRAGTGSVCHWCTAQLTPRSAADSGGTSSRFPIPLREGYCNQIPHIKLFSCVFHVLNWLIPINFPSLFQFLLSQQFCQRSLYPSNTFLSWLW